MPHTKPNTNAKDRLDEARIEEIERLTKDVFDQSPTRVAFPGGAHRAAFVAEISNELYVLAKREREADAQLEAIVLKTLSPCGHVPKFIARSGRWLIQECLSGARVPVTMNNQTKMSARVELLESSITSLLIIRDFAHQENLQHRVPKIGAKPDWLARRVGNMATISQKLDIPLPQIDPHFLQAAYQSKHQDFVKWDSRPGNALKYNDKIYWFDWEDCGRRNALDDFICLMMDEWTMIDFPNEEKLIEQYLPKFAGGMSTGQAYTYFPIASLIQIAFRLRLAIKYKMQEGKWWDREKCLAGDKVGVTPPEVTRLLNRAIRLTNGSVGCNERIKDCRVWIDNIAKKLELHLSE
ncbi:hypothetical protein [Lentilitoribacter sp. Alg239-R112]|uniref:hypothetical protein n=1 Tax=Lentilitoribacter sp. Alg239-R112 TaxID=2305987 RepID=UPI0013A69731|nr:hypothetical protein [Lentilitoribacter sp. Alg239-R112]